VLIPEATPTWLRSTKGMDMNRTSRLATAVAVSGAIAAVGVAMSAATAQANPYQAPTTTWCPGEALPFQNIEWDMNGCHTWFMTPTGTGNVRMVDLQGSPLDSFISADIPAPILTPPPPPAPLPFGTPFCSPRGSLFIIGPICDEIGVDMPPGSVRR